MGKNPHKALEAIDRLVGGDFGMDMDFLAAGGEKNPKRAISRLRQAAKVLMKIYMIAHSEGKCTHTDWEKIKYDILKQEEL